jgi:uncharacterized protein YycO
MLYVDYGQVVEAIGEGVLLRQLDEAVAQASLAVAYRHPDMTPDRALIARDFVGQQLGKGYNYAGIAGQAGAAIDSWACGVFLNAKLVSRCRHFTRDIDLSVTSRDRFFCSQLVVAAYFDNV